MNNSSVKENIRNFRKNHQVTQSEMAERLGISRTAYCNLENGETKLLNENLDKIAAILNVGTEELVLGYQPHRQTGSGNGLTEQYDWKLSEMTKRHKEEVDSLTAEISRLKVENRELRQHIETQQDLIATKSELITMLKKLK